MADQLIVDADAQELLIDYLVVKLPPLGVTLPIGGRPPQDSAYRIVVSRNGGVRRDLVTDQAQLTVDITAKTDGECVRVIGLVRAVANDMWGRVIGGYQVYRVAEISGPYANPTPQDLNRYSQSFQVAIRAAVITA